MKPAAIRTDTHREDSAINKMSGQRGDPLGENVANWKSIKVDVVVIKN